MREIPQVGIAYRFLLGPAHAAELLAGSQEGRTVLQRCLANFLGTAFGCIMGQQRSGSQRATFIHRTDVVGPFALYQKDAVEGGVIVEVLVAVLDDGEGCTVSLAHFNGKGVALDRPTVEGTQQAYQYAQNLFHNRRVSIEVAKVCIIFHTAKFLTKNLLFSHRLPGIPHSRKIVLQSFFPIRYGLKNLPCVEGVKSQSSMSVGAQCGSKHHTVNEMPRASRNEVMAGP